MKTEEIQQLGNELYSALRTGMTVRPLVERQSDITIKDAYRISLHMLQKRLDLDGEVVVGKKIGVTSKVVQDMLGVYQPDFGFLTDAMECPDGAEILIAGDLIQPKAEGEIAFLIKKNLQGPGVTEQDVLDATEAIIPCFEIVDSRIHDWKIKIEDTIADNASCGVYVLGGQQVDPRVVELPSLKMKVFKNGELEAEGLGSAVQGNPLTAVAWLANTLGEFGIPFKAGEIILSGSLTPFISIKAGDKLYLELEGVGNASCSFA